MTGEQDALRLWEPPLDGTETDTWLGSLERQRRTFAWKTDGLPAAAMRTRLGPSEVTLAGLLKHLAYMEEINFSGFLRGRPLGAPWDAVDPETRSAWVWRSAADDDPDDLQDLWRDAVARSRSAIKEALDDGGPGSLSVQRTPDGRRASTRRVLADLVEEYARHVGHADLIRESIDGLVGEDPPR